MGSCHWRSQLALLAGALCLTPRASATQASVVEGVVRDTAGQAIGSAEIVNLTTRERATASATGAFRLERLVEGPSLWVIRAIGYRPERLALTLGTADTIAIDVVLGPSPQVLPELVVEVRGHQYRGRLAEVARRARASPAPASAFIGPEELERWAPLDLGNVLRRAGLLVAGDQVACPRSSTGVTRYYGPMISIWLDGALVEQSPSFDVRTFPVQWFEAIEVYRNPVERPMEFNTRVSACSILLWTRAG